MAAVTKGILGRKVGMTQIFDPTTARVTPVTVVQAGPCRISAVRTPERDGYTAVQIAYGEVVERKLNKPELGHLKGASLPPMRHLMELRLDSTEGFELGQELLADLFAKGEKVDVTATSKGKGFTGPMRRHGFKGLSANTRVSTLNLEVVEADPVRNLILIKGSVPGPDGGLVLIRSSVKAKQARA
jgi:large subunit ribosomal protein L3